MDWYFGMQYPMDSIDFYRELLVGQEPFKEFSDQQIILGVGANYIIIHTLSRCHSARCVQRYPPIVIQYFRS